MHPAYAKVSAWLFDLDNTLYSPYCDIFPQIHVRMVAYLREQFGLNEEQAEVKRLHYLQRYGSMLRGLIEEEGGAQAHFMAYVHDVDLTTIRPDPAIKAKLLRLPGRRLVFTNADRPHAVRILAQLDLADCFESVFDVTASDYRCKPDTAPYEQLLRTYGLDARQCCMIEDTEKNLAPAAALGMRTVWLRHEAEWLRHKPLRDAAAYPHCQHVFDDLSLWLDHALGDSP